MSTTRTLTIWINGKEVENSLKSIKAEYVKLYNEVAKMTPAQEGYNEKVAELRKTEGILKEHRAQLSGGAKAWDSLKDGVAKFTPYVAAAWGAINAGKSIIESSSSASDKWTESLEGAKSGLDAVKRAVANWDFSNFWSNISKAISVGKELARMKDELEDKTRSLTVVESKYNLEIAKQRYIVADQTKSDNERKDALKEAIRLEKELSDKRVENAQLNFDINEKNIVLQSRLADTKSDATDEEKKQAEDLAKFKLKNFVEEYENNKQLRDDASNYNDMLVQMEKAESKMYGVTPEGVSYTNEAAVNQFNRLKEITSKSSDNVKTYAAILRGYVKASDEAIDGYIQSSKNLYDTNTQFFTDTMKMQKQLTGFEAELAKEKNKGSDGKKKNKDNDDDSKNKEKLAKEAAEKEKQLAEKIKQIQKSLELAKEEGYTREVREVEQKYDELFTLAKGNADATAKLEELKHEEINNIFLKYQKISQKQADDDLKNIEEDKKKKEKLAEDHEEAINNIRLALLSGDEQKKEEEIQSVKDKYEKLIALAEQYGMDTTVLYKKMQEDIDKIKKGDVDFFGMTKNDWDELKNNFDEIIQYADIALSAYRSYSDYLAQEEENELRRYEDSTDQKIALQKRRLDDGLISEKDYNRFVANYDKQLDDKKKAIANEQAKRNKQIKIFESIINTAAAVVSALPNIPLAIAVGALGAFQTALIANTEIPEYAEGGRIKNKTLLIAGEAGEEGILSNRTLNSPVTGPISNWLLDYQQGRNPRFPETVSPAIPQTSESLATGNGSISQSPQIVVQQTSNRELVDEIKRMNAYLSDPKNRQAYIPSDILKKHQEEDSLRTSISQTK